MGDDDARLFELAQVHFLNVAGQLVEHAGNYVAQIAGALAQIFVVHFGQRFGVTFAHRLERVLGVDFLFADDLDHLVNEHRVFQHQQMRFEDAALFGAHALDELPLHLMHLLAGLHQGPFEPAQFVCHFGLGQGAQGGGVVRWVEHKDPTPANPGGNRDAAENLFAFVQPLGHASGLTQTRPVEKKLFTAGEKGLSLAAAVRLGQNRAVKLRCVMSIELELQKFPKDITLKDGSKVTLRPLRKTDEKNFHELFLAIPEPERMFIKHRVTEVAIIREWCQNIDLGRNLPLVAVQGGKILGDATLHQQLGGWKRHIGRVSVLVHPQYRGKGLARALVSEIVDIARNVGLEKVEAEFIGGQEAAIHMFAMLGFSELVRLEDYVKDMQAISHEYVLMGLNLHGDEEYAGVGG